VGGVPLSTHLGAAPAWARRRRHVVKHVDARVELGRILELRSVSAARMDSAGIAPPGAGRLARPRIMG